MSSPVVKYTAVDDSGNAFPHINIQPSVAGGSDVTGFSTLEYNYESGQKSVLWHEQRNFAALVAQSLSDNQISTEDILADRLFQFFLRKSDQAIGQENGFGMLPTRYIVAAMAEYFSHPFVTGNFAEALVMSALPQIVPTSFPDDFWTLRADGVATFGNSKLLVDVFVIDRSISPRSNIALREKLEKVAQAKTKVGEFVSNQDSNNTFVLNNIFEAQTVPLFFPRMFKLDRTFDRDYMKGYEIVDFNLEVIRLIRDSGAYQNHEQYLNFIQRYFYSLMKILQI